MRNTLLPLLFLAALLGGCAAAPPPGGAPTPTAIVQPTSVPPTATAIGSLENCGTITATNFYQALKAKDTMKAYSYLTASATMDSGQKLTYAVFVQQVQAGGTATGDFTFTIGGFAPDPPVVIMTIDNKQLRYHSHLHIARVDNVCSINSLDRI